MSLLISMLVVVLAWLPLQCVRLLRMVQCRGDVVVRLTIDGSSVTGSKAAAQRNEDLRTLANDHRVQAVFVRLQGTPGGWAELQELRQALQAVRDAQKTVVVYLEQGANPDMYLASVANQVWMPPVGELFVCGFGGRLNFLGGLLKRLGVVVDFEAAGDYKSFGEPFSRGFASPANREQLEALYGDLQQQLLDGIAEGRGLAPAQVSALMAASPLGAEAAIEIGLIDRCLYSDELKDAVAEVLGHETSRVVSFSAYRRWRKREQRLASAGWERAQLAVVHLEGSIVLGEDTPKGRQIASRCVVPVLRQIRADDSIRAVVLRVDSGGGSALASDLIAREVQQLGQEKPVVVSFGNIVASGGYYLSVVARELIAQPGSITGSIGVFGGKVVISDALQRVGLTGDVVEVGPDVGFLGPWRHFTDSQRRRFRSYLERTYALFLSIVAGGRRCPVAAIEPHAGGRIWTGQQAKQRNLIDHHGGLPFALSRARALSSLAADQGRVVHVDFSPSRWQQITTLAAAQGPKPMADMLLNATGADTELLRLLREHPGQAMAVAPWVLEHGDQSPYVRR